RIVRGNHRPRLTSVNEAIRRRINVVPFLVTIAPEKRDKDLAEKLKAEWAGILAWMIEGCIAWQRNGLQTPQAVLDATKEYLTSEDTLGRWIEECCMLDSAKWTPSAQLFGSYTPLAKENHEAELSTTAFGRAMRDRGFRPGHKETGNGFYGLVVRALSVWSTTAKSK